LHGELEVVKEVHRKHIMEMKEDGNEQNGEADLEIGTAGIVTETSKVPFLMLGLDLPPPPLFKDAMEKNIIPQARVSQESPLLLYNLMADR
jgi:U4/U6.U5 tri-snRNP-associated protein 2